MPEHLSPHFTVEEFERSQTAARHGIRNRMGPVQRASAAALCRHVLEPLRAVVGPISVSSGYRSPAVNARVGGAPTSQHTAGQAVDFATNALPVGELFDLIRLLGLPFDQLIEEYGRWVHASYGPRHRRQALVKRAAYTNARPAVLTDRMRAVVAAFQRRAGFVGPAVDGVPGPLTLRAAVRMAETPAARAALPA